MTSDKDLDFALGRWAKADPLGGAGDEAALLRILQHADAIAMTERGPKARLIEFPGMGHAPALMADDQIAVVRDWLLAD